MTSSVGLERAPKRNAKPASPSVVRNRIRAFRELCDPSREALVFIPGETPSSAPHTHDLQRLRHGFKDEHAIPQSFGLFGPLGGWDVMHLIEEGAMEIHL